MPNDSDIAERLTAIEVTVRSIESNFVSFDARVTPLLLQQSGVLGRIERAEADLSRAFDKVRETETWKAQIEGRLGKHDSEFQRHVDSANATMEAIGKRLDEQAKVNAAFFAHKDEWGQWKYKLLGSFLVIQSLAGLAFIFKDDLSRALFGGGG